MKERIDLLLVEDNEDHVFLTSEALVEGTGDALNIHVARDGEEALDFVYRRGGHADAPRPDLILLDIRLPRKDGFEVLKELKESPEYRSIPIIMLTSSDAEMDVVRGYGLGNNAYIAKPIRFEDFAERIQGLRAFWDRVALLPPKRES